MNLASILRHWFTYAATAASVWLIAALTLSAEDAHKLTEAMGLLVEPLIVIVTLVAVALWRVVLAKAGTIFQRGAGETDDDSAGGLSPCVMGLCVAAAGLLVFPLSSCSPAQIAAVRAVPLKVCATYHGVEVCAESAK